VPRIYNKCSECFVWSPDAARAAGGEGETSGGAGADVEEQGEGARTGGQDALLPQEGYMLHLTL